MKGVVKSVQEQGQDTAIMYGDSSQAFITILATGEYRVKGRVNEQNIGEIMEGEAALIRSRVDEDQVWTGTFTAVDTKILRAIPICPIIQAPMTVHRLLQHLTLLCGFEFFPGTSAGSACIYRT